VPRGGSSTAVRRALLQSAGARPVARVWGALVDGRTQGFVAGLKEAAQRLRGSGSGKESAGISGGHRGHCAGAWERRKGMIVGPA